MDCVGHKIYMHRPADADAALNQVTKVESDEPSKAFSLLILFIPLNVISLQHNYKTAHFAHLRRGV